jgi:hypothetical protein
MIDLQKIKKEYEKLELPENEFGVPLCVSGCPNNTSLDICLLTSKFVHSDINTEASCMVWAILMEDKMRRLSSKEDVAKYMELVDDFKKNVDDFLEKFKESV